MSKLLQVIAGAANGGAELFFSRLAIALEESGQNQKVVIRKNREWSRYLRDGQVDTEEMAFGGTLDFLTALRLKRLVESYRPDIVFTWMNRATRKMFPGSFIHVARLGGYYKLKNYKNCDHLIGNTQKIVDYIIHEGWSPERAHYIPNFASERIGEPVQKSSFHTPQDAPLILALGRLHENKGFDVLLQALSHIPEGFLWLAGTGKQREMLEALASDLGVSDRVRFLGWHSDTCDLLATCDIFVCPSRHEPLGNVILEAWVQKKPVVATCCDGPKQIVGDGENGLLCEIDQPESLAAAITTVLSDANLASSIALAGHRTYESNYTKKIVVRQYKEFFESLLK
ncbi:MAG: glycosyl transferase [Rhodospirillaceae bacterium]|nr:glycosyl transferase [Rhodospirillaceae bacterium]